MKKINIFEKIQRILVVPVLIYCGCIAVFLCRGEHISDVMFGILYALNLIYCVLGIASENIKEKESKRLLNPDNGELYPVSDTPKNGEER